VNHHLTLATSTGVAFLSLAFHVATGLVAIGAGFVAIATRKGGTWHRASGRIFVYTMIATGIVAAVIATYEGKPTAFGAAFTAYLVFTAYTTVKPLPAVTTRVQIALMLLSFALAAAAYPFAFIALGRPGHQLDGVPAGMMFFTDTIMLLAAIGDARMIHAGGIHGARRLARHLWRMSFGLFIASGSFFIGQTKFIPRPLRIMPVLLSLGIAPLVLLVYWMWRVRLRKNLRGMRTVKPVEARAAA
jgi:hypothetical protein